MNKTSVIWWHFREGICLTSWWWTKGIKCLQCAPMTPIYKPWDTGWQMVQPLTSDTTFWLNQKVVSLDTSSAFTAMNHHHGGVIPRVHHLVITPLRITSPTWSSIPVMIQLSILPWYQYKLSNTQLSFAYSCILMLEYDKRLRAHAFIITLFDRTLYHMCSH